MIMFWFKITFLLFLTFMLCQQSDASKGSISKGNSDTETKLTTLEDRLKELPVNMRLFSLAMRSLYAEKAVGTSTNAAKMFRSLRDATRNDAVVYLNVLLPSSQKYISSLKEYFEYYAELSFEDWVLYLKDILKEAKSRKENAEILLHLHESIMVSLKKREDLAVVIVKSLKSLSGKLNEEKKKLKQSFNKKYDWAVGLSFIPLVNIIAVPLLVKSADKDLIAATGKADDALIAVAAADAISSVLIPALKHYLGGLTAAAGFFSVTINELQEFIDKGDTAKSNPLKLYYEIMKSKAKYIITSCRAFFFVLPNVRTDFEAIPTTGTNNNYVHHWVKKQTAELEKKFATSTVNGVLKATQQIG